MRIARVIAKVTLNHAMPETRPGSYLVVRTLNRGSLAGQNEGNDETVVLFDELSAREGDLVGLVEGAEAAAAFYPDKVPYDSYNGCIFDTIDFEPILKV